MRFRQTDNDKYKLLATILIILVGLVSTGLAVAYGHREAKDIRQRLSERSQTLAGALGASEVMKLKGLPSDGDTKTYRDLKAKLAAAAEPDARIRSIYLTGINDGRLFFYVDSETPDSRDYSPAAEWYDEATPEFKAIFANGQPLVEGPVSDKFGTFISGLAPIFQPGSKTVAAVIGIDVGADTYRRDVLLAAALPLLAGTSTIIVIVVFEWIRRRNLQLLAVKSELVSVASHELRTPINGIRWAAENMKDINTQKSLKHLIDAVHEIALNLESSTDDILELSHDMNRAKLNLAPTDMVKLIQEILKTQSLAAEQKGVPLEMAATWPTELVINCDADKMKRVLNNIVSNAIKYSHHKTPVAIDYQKTEGMHQILITDKGIGIPKAEQVKVFKGFYRASNAVESDIPGTGLGLFLVKTVMEQHGGRVSFTSSPNKGTTFSLYLPAESAK